MIYRELGRTGLKVSQLGFGAMRLPMVGEGKDASVDLDLAIPMIHRAFAGGVNYIDTATGYCNQDSQRAVGEALKGWRDKVVVSTKNAYYGEDEQQWWTNLEQSLERLDVDFIDVYNHHGVNAKHYDEAVRPRVSKWMLKAKGQGLIKHICCSFHDNNDALLKIIDDGYAESITLQYNMLDQQLTQGIAHAREKNVGVVVMGPVGGGRLGERSEVLARLIPGVSRVPELALRFVLANRNVTMALSGMSTMQQVEENLVTASDAVSLSADDLGAIEEHLKRLKSMADLYCTGCGYCMPCEAAGVDIPGIFEKFNRARVYGLWDHAREAYAKMGKVPWSKGKPADACVQCGACEDKCPQHIEIRKQLAEAHAALSNQKN